MNKKQGKSKYIIIKSHLKEYFEPNGDRIVGIWVDYLPSSSEDGMPYENCEMRSFRVKNDKERDEAKAYLIKNWEYDINGRNRIIEWGTK